MNSIKRRGESSRVPRGRETVNSRGEVEAESHGWHGLDRLETLAQRSPVLASGLVLTAKRTGAEGA